MMYAGRTIFVIAVVAASVAALPNHLKAVVVDTDPIPKETSVSASFGGYSAKAGLGGSPAGGGLFASADSPQGSASAGLGGTAAGEGGLGASASTGGGPAVSTGTGVPSKPGTGHKPGHQGPGIFDGIFNIPISVLQAVNTYLNNRGPVTKPVHRRRGHQPPVEKTVIPEQASPDSSAPEAGAGVAAAADKGPSSAGAEAGAHPAPHGPLVIQKRVNYDDIFNIPISALKSVNQLLNGKK